MVNRQDIVAYLQEEIDNLTRVRDFLSGKRQSEASTRSVKVHPSVSEPVRPSKRNMSAAARRRISQAQKARWALQRGATQTSAADVAGGATREGAKGFKSRVLSPATRKKIAAAQKARWARHRKQTAKKE